MLPSVSLPVWPEKVLFLRPLDAMADLATEQMARAWQRAGRPVAWSVLRRSDETPQQASGRVRQEVERFSPDLCVVNGGMGFHTPALYLPGGPLWKCPVAALWFDDPLRATQAFSRLPGYVEALRAPCVVHWVWDGYWREWLAKTWQVSSLGLHLAADPDDYFPLPRHADHGDALVFVGTFADPDKLALRLELLPPLLRKAALQLERAIAAAEYRANPFDVWERLFDAMPGTVRHPIHDLLSTSPSHASELLALAWQWGKNATRLRALRAAASTGRDLLLLCGNVEGNVACPEQIRAWLGSPRVHVQNTCHLPADRLRELYAYGQLHFQSTDPQSRHGGIPFRAFHTPACGRALLSDATPELLACFEPGREMVFYENETDLADRLRFYMDRPRVCEEIGQAARARFLNGHTWLHRWRDIGIGVREELHRRQGEPTGSAGTR